MKKTILTVMLAIALVFSFSVGAKAEFKDMWAYVYSWDGSLTADGKYELTKITSGITYAVMMRNSMATLETLYIYNNQAMVTTGMNNPVTGTSFTDAVIGADMLRFRVDPTEANDTYVDLIVVDQAGGYTAFVEDFTENKHTIVIDERLNVRHHGCAFIVTTDSSVETETGIDFDDITIIDQMMIEVGTGFPTDVQVSVGIDSSGTNGDHDGFIFQELLSTVGFHNCWRDGVDLTSYTFSSAAGSAVVSETVSRPSGGTWLMHYGAGSNNTVTTYRGHIIRDQLLIYGTWENSLTYTFATSQPKLGWGIIHFWFTRIR